MLQCNTEKSVNKTHTILKHSSPRTYLNCIFIFEHILVQANKIILLWDLSSKFSNEMICKVYVLLIGRVNHIFHRLLILKFVSKPQLDQFLWVTGSVVNTHWGCQRVYQGVFHVRMLFRHRVNIYHSVLSWVQPGIYVFWGSVWK